jgi:hypothetical protein
MLPLEIKQCGGKKNQGNKHTKDASPVQIMTDQKKLKTVEYFSCLGSIITSDARCTREIKSRTATAKQHSTGRRLFSTSKPD